MRFRDFLAGILWAIGLALIITGVLDARAGDRVFVGALAWGCARALDNSVDDDPPASGSGAAGAAA